MGWNPFQSDAVTRKLKAARAELAAIARQKELDQAEAELKKARDDQAYKSADPSERSRLDMQREVMREEIRERHQRYREQQAKLRQARKASVKIDPQAISLLVAAQRSVGIQTTEQIVTMRAQESILDALNGTPFAFDLLAEYRNLLQVPTLIRELWPYKPTILRTQPMLDFARWICRVVYEECLTAKGLVKGKVNYICRGAKVKVVPKEGVELPSDEDLPQKIESSEHQLAAKAIKRKEEKGGGVWNEKKQAYEAEALPEEVEPKQAEAEADSEEGIDESDPTMEEAQRLLEAFIEENDYLDKRRERRRRMMIEGEAFMWLTLPDEGLEECAPVCCFVEPDYIRPSQKNFVNQEDPSLGGIPGPDWSFGIRTPHHQYWKPLEYQIVWNDNEEQKVDAADMFHTAVRERGNIKRCLPPMFAMADDLIRMTLLRAALADSSKFRAGIGGVVKYEEATQQSIRDWESSVSSGQLGLDVQPPELVPLEAETAANLISLPPGRDFVKGPDYPDVGSLEMIYLWHVRAIAQAEQVPEWLVSGAGGEGSFASSLTAESVSIIEFDAEQEKDCAQDKRVFKRVLQFYIDENLLDADFFDRYDLQVEGEAMVSRDAKSEMECAVLAINNKLCSIATARTNLGFDDDHENSQIEAEQAAGIGPQPQQAIGPDGEPTDGGPQTMGGERQKLEGEDPA